MRNYLIKSHLFIDIVGMLCYNIIVIGKEVKVVEKKIKKAIRIVEVAELLIIKIISLIGWILILKEVLGL